jgi:hypothetical protein
MRRANLWAVAAVGLVAGAGRADDDPTHRWPSTAVHTFERAGNPQSVAPWAIWGRTSHEGGGYVGGGRLALFPRKPDGRQPETDGTWGWDFVGFGRRPGRVFLDWWHERPQQPLPGKYNTDGPYPEDVVAKKPVKTLYDLIKGGGHGGEGKKE